MPSKLLGIDFPGRRNIHSGFHNSIYDRRQAKDDLHHTVTEIRRPSMDHLIRPTLGLSLGKRHGSHDRRTKSKERSQSKDKRRAGSRDTRDKDVTRSPGLPPQKPVTLNMFMESPPAMFIDSPASSSGALISGRVQVTPNLPSVTLTSINMFLEATVSTKRPVVDRCRECSSQVDDLYEWKFLSQPKTFEVSKGMQELPFSHLIPGHLPVTTHGHIGFIDYSLHVRAITSDGTNIEFRRPLPVLRALRPGNDKNSVRIFPPTNLTLHVTLPSIIHPIGEFPVTCRMTGIVTRRDDTQTRWRIRKLTWRIEEHETMVSPACAKHHSKVGGEGKGIKHENVREVGSEELKSGWKTDLSDGQIDGEFMASIDSATNPQCDVDSPNGLKISHNLVIELVIAEEWAPNKKPSQITPTGAARVLRTQFNLNLTERAGLGIAWDDEMPPVYEDVPASPPHYPVDARPAATTTAAAAATTTDDDSDRRGSSGGNTTMEDYDGDDLHEDVEALSLQG